MMIGSGTRELRSAFPMHFGSVIMKSLGMQKHWKGFRTGCFCHRYQMIGQFRIDMLHNV